MYFSAVYALKTFRNDPSCPQTSTPPLQKHSESHINFTSQYGSVLFFKFNVIYVVVEFQNG